jgi:hypothetical protein
MRCRTTSARHSYGNGRIGIIGADTRKERSAGVNRLACRASLIADKLFGPPAPFASESDEIRLGFPDLVLSYHHERAAVQARRILSGVQRIEQEFLVAKHRRPLTEA